MQTHQQFQETIWEHFEARGRDLPWRHEPFDAYAVLVSEMMLQQTQVTRVAAKYHLFLELFPSLQKLAEAPLADVIRAWSGLGYNRRAKYLHEASAALLAKKEPWTLQDLTQCKGIGFNTAAAVLTYAYNQPIAFVETNIRTVYIHHFFSEVTEPRTVTDKELLPFVEQTLDREHPREFMWALMDYGSFLKASLGNVARLSRHHQTQSRFEGSRRQIRGHVLRLLHENDLSPQELKKHLNDERAVQVLGDLADEGLIELHENNYRLAQ